MPEASFSSKMLSAHCASTQSNSASRRIGTFQEEGRTTVCQVSLFGFELILNQIGERTRTRAGHGRVFIGLEDDQGEPLRKHILATGIRPSAYQWGRPTLVVKDLDAQ